MNFISNFKRLFLLNFYRGCLKETEFRIKLGHTKYDSTLRFFKLKVLKYSKK